MLCHYILEKIFDVVTKTVNFF